MVKKMVNPIEKMIDKSIDELKANSKAVETALEKLLKQEGIEISSQEFSEIKYLTDTMNDLDELLLTLTKQPEKKKVKPKKKKVKRRK
jgi:type IV secretory pathway VirB4 component